MKKYFSKIIVSAIIVAIFLAPISAGIKTDKNNNLVTKIEVNEAKAWDFKAATLNDIFGTSFIVSPIDPKYINSTAAVFSGEIKVSEGYKQHSTDPGKGNLLEIYSSIGNSSNPEKGIHFIIKEKDSTRSWDKTWSDLGVHTGQSKGFDSALVNNPFTINTSDIAGPLTPGKTYTVSIQIEDDRSFWVTGLASGGPYNSIPVPFTTTVAKPNDPTLSNLNNAKAAYGEGELNLGCTDFTSISLPTCVAQLSYIIWSVAAAITRFAGEFLDFFVYYSTNSSSYNNDFVKQGWGAVRDIANIFFIIALLYVAIKTILGLNVTDNKKLIGAVIVVALVINFSLFATQIVIDGSNILAKVFYNNITSVDKNGAVLAAEDGGQKSISVGLVDKFNPQSLITQAIYNQNKYTFIFMTLIIAGVLLYMTYIFFSVALLFVARVVSLWLSMIFSPLAFASFTVPFDLGGLGHKKWWSNLIEDAFLAPIFIFFLYIIVLFTKFLTNIINYTDSPNLNDYANIMQHLMSVIIPFAMIVMLLAKAKKIAVEYSGKMGATVTKIGSMVGGAALGVGAGVAAFGARQTVGRVAANVAESNRFRDWASRNGKFGEGVLRTTSGIGAGSFDVRGIKVRGKGLADTGLTNMGKAQAGGFAGARTAAVKRQEEFAKKSLDTTALGINKLTRGMSIKEAANTVDQMSKGGMDLTDSEKIGYQMKLRSGDINLSQAKDIALHLSQARRNNFADQKQNSIFATNRIAADKIRKDAKTLKDEASVQHTLEHLAHELAPQTGEHGGKHEEKHEEAHPAPAAHPPTPTTPPEGGNEHKH